MRLWGRSACLLLWCLQSLVRVCLSSMVPCSLFHADLFTPSIAQTAVPVAFPQKDGCLCMLYLAVLSWPSSCLGLFAYGKFFLSVRFSMTRLIPVAASPSPCLSVFAEQDVFFPTLPSLSLYCLFFLFASNLLSDPDNPVNFP